MLNQTEYLLTCLSEECSEIIKECTKAQRFGVNDVDPNARSSLQNGQKIACEMADLMAVFELLVENGNMCDGRGLRRDIENKKQKVRQWMEYSRKQGCLEPEQSSRES
jgi:hypothetical protein